MVYAGALHLVAQMWNRQGRDGDVKVVKGKTLKIETPSLLQLVLCINFNKLFF